MKRALLLLLALLAGPATAQAPPPVPALPDSPRLTSYSLSGTTCACSVGWAIYGDGTDVDNWIDVFLNGVSVLSTDQAHGWSLSSATGALGSIPRPITNAVLTFAQPQTGNVTIVGARRPRRLTQFQENRGVTARDLNQVITDEIAMLRETWDHLNRTVAGPPGEVLNPLPPALTRAGGTLVFDGSGQPAVSVIGGTAPPVVVDGANIWSQLQTFNGGVVINGPAGLRVLGTTDTSWTVFDNPVGVVAAENNNSFVGSVVNTFTMPTLAFPTGVTGYGKVAPGSNGNTAFGLFGLAELDATSGVATNEVTVRNNCGPPDTNLPPNEAIPNGVCVTNGLQVTAGGMFNSSIGIRIDNEGGSGRQFNTGLYFGPNGCAQWCIQVGTGVYWVQPNGYFGGQGMALVGNVADVTPGTQEIGYGGQFVTPGTDRCPSGTVGGQTIAGCIIANVSGAVRYLPYF